MMVTITSITENKPSDSTPLSRGAPCPSPPSSGEWIKRGRGSVPTSCEACLALSPRGVCQHDWVGFPQKTVSSDGTEQQDGEESGGYGSNVVTDARPSGSRNGGWLSSHVEEVKRIDMQYSTAIRNKLNESCVLEEFTEPLATESDLALEANPYAVLHDEGEDGCSLSGRLRGRALKLVAFYEGWA